MLGCECRTSSLLALMVTLLYHALRNTYIINPSLISVISAHQSHLPYNVFKCLTHDPIIILCCSFTRLHHVHRTMFIMTCYKRAHWSVPREYSFYACCNVMDVCVNAFMMMSMAYYSSFMFWDTISYYYSVITEGDCMNDWMNRVFLTLSWMVIQR